VRFKLRNLNRAGERLSKSSGGELHQTDFKRRYG
jgi:hypothetical protein